MMKLKFMWAVILLTFVHLLNAQIIDPIHPKATIKQIGDQVYEMQMDVTIDTPWHLYSLDEQEFGIPTTINFENKKNTIQLLDSTRVIGKVKLINNDLGDQKVFEKSVRFIRRFKLLKPTAQVIANIDYQVCNDNTCLAPTQKLVKLTIPASAIAEKIQDDQANMVEPIKKDTSEDSLVATDTVQIPLNEELVPQTPTQENADSPQIKGVTLATIDKAHPISDCTTDNSKKDLWTIFGLGFLGGFLAILMPCVFPMIPLTVSFFTKSKDKKSGLFNAFLYGFFIILIYVLLSVPFHIFDNLSSNILNQISTNFWLNIAFFIVFIAFALSFFGYYELALPSSWANKANTSSNKEGIAGSFFMALTLAIVSFSCTGPILGLLLVNAITAEDGAYQLTAAMSGFGIALALPFTLFALFPNLLKSLPKSGGWMVTLKVIIGFVELALAFKFLSKADLVGLNGPVGLLKNEIFIGIWIIIMIGLILYLLKIIRFPHDDKNDKKITNGRWAGVILVIAFVGYLITGLPKSGDLPALSGLVPPSNYSVYAMEESGEEHVEIKQGITIYVNDLEKAMQIAKNSNKPVLVDFTGYGCENCRRMEDNVWVDPAINAILKNDVVVVSLYVDSTEELPEAEQQIVDIPGANNTIVTKKINTVGDKWASFQAVNFKNNSQPNYALLTPDGRLLNADIAGYKGVDEFKDFLDCGISTFKKQ